MFPSQPSVQPESPDQEHCAATRFRSTRWDGYECDRGGKFRGILSYGSATLTCALTIWSVRPKHLLAYISFLELDPDTIGLFW
jgi:hypothetical protein